MMLATSTPSRGMALLVTMLALGACDDGGDDDGMANDDASQPSMCDEEDRADAFTVGLSQMGEQLSVAVVEADPAVPVRGDNTWTVMLTDGSGAPMEGATIDVKPWMPDHGHGSPVEEMITELGAGEYEVTPLNLFMAGYWEVTIETSDAEGVTDSVMFAICVD